MAQHPLIARLRAKPLGYEDTESNRIWRETHRNDNNGKMVHNTIVMKVPWHIKEDGSTSRRRLGGTKRGWQTQAPTGARPAATSHGEGHQDLLGPNLIWEWIEADLASPRLGPSIMHYDGDIQWAPPSTHSSRLTTWFLIIPNRASPHPVQIPPFLLKSGTVTSSFISTFSLLPPTILLPGKNQRQTECGSAFMPLLYSVTSHVTESSRKRPTTVRNTHFLEGPREFLKSVVGWPGAPQVLDGSKVVSERPGCSVPHGREMVTDSPT